MVEERTGRSTRLPGVFRWVRGGKKNVNKREKRIAALL